MLNEETKEINYEFDQKRISDYFETTVFELTAPGMKPRALPLSYRGSPLYLPLVVSFPLPFSKIQNEVANGRPSFMLRVFGDMAKENHCLRFKQKHLRNLHSLVNFVQGVHWLIS